MNDKQPVSLSKPTIDIGYFTDNLTAQLEFWRDEFGLSCEPAVNFNQGLTQYRHALGDSVIKVNTSSDQLPKQPTAYRELMICDADVGQPQSLKCPDGNLITRVPPGYCGIDGLGLKIAVQNVAAYGHFLTSAMGFEQCDATSFRCGRSVLVLEPAAAGQRNAHWVNQGLSYFTVHVMRVDEAFAAMVAAGATVGERPYSIERIARISFIRDLDGNWIEVAQRASLAGPWWED